MNELLKQALWLTVMGMGMTFLAIGALVGLMYLITALAPEKGAEEKAEAAEPVAVAEEVPTDDDARERAAAAAVVLALTLETARHRPAEGQADDPWTIYARSQKLRRSL